MTILSSERSGHFNAALAIKTTFGQMLPNINQNIDLYKLLKFYQKLIVSDISIGQTRNFQTLQLKELG